MLIKMKTTNRPGSYSLIPHLDATILRYLGPELALAAAELRLPIPPRVPSFGVAEQLWIGTAACNDDATVRPMKRAA